MGLSEAISIAEQIASALGVMHAGGIIHGRLEPGNIVLRPSGRVTVFDFGLTELLPPIDVDVLAPAGWMDAFPYMAPELIEGKGLDGRSDLFSLGVVFYEMLARRQPFNGKTPLEVAGSIVSESPAPVSQFRKDLDRFPGKAELERILGKALARHREDRYQTAEDLTADLVRLSRVTPRKNQ